MCKSKREEKKIVQTSHHILFRFRIRCRLAKCWFSKRIEMVAPSTLRLVRNYVNSANCYYGNVVFHIWNVRCDCIARLRIIIFAHNFLLLQLRLDLPAVAVVHRTHIHTCAPPSASMCLFEVLRKLWEIYIVEWRLIFIYTRVSCSQ